MSEFVSVLVAGKDCFWSNRNLFGKVFFLWTWPIILIMASLEGLFLLTEKSPTPPVQHEKEDVK